MRLQGRHEGGGNGYTLHRSRYVLQEEVKVPRARRQRRIRLAESGKEGM